MVYTMLRSPHKSIRTEPVFGATSTTLGGQSTDMMDDHFGARDRNGYMNDINGLSQYFNMLVLAGRIPQADAPTNWSTYATIVSDIDHHHHATNYMHVQRFIDVSLHIMNRIHAQNTAHQSVAHRNTTCRESKQQSDMRTEVITLFRVIRAWCESWYEADEPAVDDIPTATSQVDWDMFSLVANSIKNSDVRVGDPTTLSLLADILFPNRSKIVDVCRDVGTIRGTSIPWMVREYSLDQYRAMINMGFSAIPTREGNATTAKHAGDIINIISRNYDAWLAGQWVRVETLSNMMGNVQI